MAKASGAVSNQAAPRVLLYDIETSHNILAKFDLREEWTPHTNILHERYVICAAWRWLGERRTQAVSALDNPARFKANPNDDRHVLDVMHGLLSQADVIVAHNGERFDIKWLNGRFLFHGMAPLKPLRSVDTLRVAKRTFALNSNRLDYLGKYLGLGGKTSTPPGLWIDALKGDEKAIKRMVAYNKRDVNLLMGVFMKLRPYTPDYINRQFFSGNRLVCPKCGSSHIQSRGTHHALTQSYRSYQCQAKGCRGWFRDRIAIKGSKTTTRSLP